MAGNTVSTLALAKRAEVWGAELKEILRDELQGMKYVNWLNDFPDGDTFKIPSLGDATINNYTEDAAVTYDQLMMHSLHLPSLNIYRLVTTSPIRRCRMCITQIRSCLSLCLYKNVP